MKMIGASASQPNLVFHCQILTLIRLSLLHSDSFSVVVAKMASHAIFQYNVSAIDDTHNTWTNVIVEMTILRLLGSRDDKEKIGIARPNGPPLRSKGFED